MHEYSFKFLLNSSQAQHLAASQWSQAVWQGSSYGEHFSLVCWGTPDAFVLRLFSSCVKALRTKAYLWRVEYTQWAHSQQPTAQPYRLPQLKSGLIYSTLTPDRWSYSEISWRHLYFFSIHLSSFTFKPWPTKAYSQLRSKFKRSKNTEKCNQCHTSSLSSTKFGLLVLAQSRQANSTKTIHWLFPQVITSVGWKSNQTQFL